MYYIDQLVKILTLPFTETSFLKNDLFLELSKKKLVRGGSQNERAEDYRSFLKKVLHPKIIKAFQHCNLLRNEDEIKLLLNKFYKPETLINIGEKDSDPITRITDFYFKHLAKIASSFLTHRDGRLVLKYWHSEQDEIIKSYTGLEKITLWHSMNKSINTELFSLIYLIYNGYTDACNLRAVLPIVPIEDSQLERVLSEGMAETHLHINAGGHFKVLWSDEMSLNKRREMDDFELWDGTNFTPHIRAASYLRILLSLFLTSAGKKDFSTLFYTREIKEFYDCVKSGKEFNKWEIFQDIKFRFSLDEKSGDILASIKEWKKYSYLNYEQLFLFESFKYIQKSLSNGGDPLFYKMFLYYIRVKNITFQAVTQHNNTVKGLDYFDRYYKKATGRIPNWAERIRNIIEYQLADKDLLKLEMRLAFRGDNYKKTIKDDIITVLEKYLEVMNTQQLLRKSSQATQIGFIFHLIKMEDKKYLEKCWMNFADDEDKCHLRYPNIIDEYNRQISALNYLRNKIPGLSNFIVGIDAASVEYRTEPWVFAPVYKKARGGETPLFNHNSEPIKKLGFTFHVGEDFRNILTGLRHIDEVMTHFGYHAGDRIGHGIALGLNVDKWFKKHRVILMPRGEYLDNLLWIWGLNKYDKYPISFDPWVIELKIMKYAEAIYTNLEGITVYALWQAYQNKFTQFNGYYKTTGFYAPEDSKNYPCSYSVSCERLFCHYVEKDERIIWNVEKLSLAQHCKIYLEKMCEPIYVEIDKDKIEPIIKLQKFIAEKVAREGIVVETNPSSNVTIGAFEDICEHYILNLNDRDVTDNHDSSNGVMVTINTDDPVVFNTCLSNEFAYIFYVLQDKGYSREDILKWIDRIRENGMKSSFIPDRNIIWDDCRNDNCKSISYKMEIEKLIKELKK